MSESFLRQEETRMEAWSRLKGQSLRRLVTYDRIEEGKTFLQRVVACMRRARVIFHNGRERHG